MFNAFLIGGPIVYFIIVMLTLVFSTNITAGIAMCMLIAGIAKLLWEEL